MDDGTNRGFLKEDELVCREVSLEFWRTYRNLEVLNIVTVDSNEQILTGKIKHDPGSKTFILHRFNSNFQDVEFDLSNVKHIYAVEFASRECTLNYSHENN